MKNETFVMKNKDFYFDHGKESEVT